MANDGVKYSDLLIPDDSIVTAIKQWEELIKSYDEGLKRVADSANKFKTAVGGANSTTAEGKNVIADSTAEIERLAKAQRDLNASRGEAAQEIAKLKLEQQELNNINKLTAKYNSGAEGSYNKLSALYSLNSIQLNKMSDAERRLTKEGVLLEKQTKDIYQQMIKLQEATGKHTLSVGNYEKATIRLGTSFNQLSRELPSLGVNMNTFFLAISNNIPMLVDEINNVREANSKLAAEGKQISPLGKMLTSAIFSWQTLMSVSIALLTVYGADIVKWVKGMVSATNVIDDQTKAMRSWNSAMLDGQQTAEQELVHLKVIYNASQNWVRGREYQIAAIKELKKEYPSYFKNLEDEYILLGNASKIYEELTDNILNFSKAKAVENTIVKNYEQIIELTKDLNTRLDELKENSGTVFMPKIWKIHDIEKQIKSLENQNESLITSLSANYFFGGEKGVEENGGTSPAKNAFDLVKILEETTDIMVDIYRSGMDRELTQSQYKYEREKLLLEQSLQDNIDNADAVSAINNLLKVKEEKYLSDQDAIREKYAAKYSSDLEKSRKEREDAVGKIYQEEIDGYNLEYDLKISEIDLLKATEAEKTKLRLQAEKDRLQKILQFNKSGIQKLSDVEVEIIKNMIAKIDNEMSSTGEKNGDIYSLIGLNLNDDKKKAIETSTSFAITNLNTILDAKVRMADIAVRNAEKEISAAQKSLDYELQARANGYASNVSMAQKELNLAKKNQEDAIKEREKAQKQQLAIQAIEQGSNLVTASSLIWSQLGFPWAIPALAIMWGSFIASKVKASQLVRAENKTYGEGGFEFLEGGSHASGNDISLGMTSDGKNRRAEGGEALAIINKSKTKKYRSILPDVINSLNQGIFEKKYMGAFDMGGTSINLVQNTTDLKNIERDVSELRKQGETKMHSSGSKTIIQYKNLTTYVK